MSLNGTEWNRWRGEQTTLMELIRQELSEIDNRLKSMEKEFYIFKGKSMAYGGVAGLCTSALIYIAIRFITP